MNVSKSASQTLAGGAIAARQAQRSSGDSVSPTTLSREISADQRQFKHIIEQLAHPDKQAQLQAENPAGKQALAETPEHCLSSSNDTEGSDDAGNSAANQDAAAGHGEMQGCDPLTGQILPEDMDALPGSGSQGDIVEQSASGPNSAAGLAADHEAGDLAESDARHHDDRATDLIPITLSGLEPAFANNEAASMIQADGTSQGTASTTLNQAVTRMIDEMLARARRSEIRRWQFSLPGLFDGSVVVTIELTEDQQWQVDLSSSENLSEDDQKALENRLGNRLQSVDVRVALSGT